MITALVAKIAPLLRSELAYELSSESATTVSILDVSADSARYTGSGGKTGRIAEMLFWLLLIAYILVISSFRFFPSQDGAVHLYYADVIKQLHKTPSAYGAYYGLKSLIPPYALTTYVLIVLTDVMSAQAAEKFLVIAYLILFCLGVRYLIASLRVSPAIPALMALPLALNFTLHMGFYNFSLGIGVMLFAAGFWVRSWRRFNVARVLIAFALSVMLLFTHPVPLLLFIVFAGLHTAVTLIHHVLTYEHVTVKGRLRDVFSTHRAQGVALLLVAIPLLYLPFFVSRAPATPLFASGDVVRGHIFALPSLATILPVEDGWHFIPLAVLMTIVLSSVMVSLKSRRDPDHVATFLFSVLWFLAFLVAPSWVNGSADFDMRFPIFGILFLVATGARAFAGQTPRRAYTSILASIAIACLILEARDLRTANRWLAVLASAPATISNARGAIVASPTFHGAVDPCGWAPASYFRRSHAVLLNAPWLSLDIMMLRTAQRHPIDGLDPVPMAAYLRQGPDVRKYTSLDFIIGVSCNGADTTVYSEIAKRYGLVRMPWSTSEFGFYVKPGVAKVPLHLDSSEVEQSSVLPPQRGT